MNTPVSRFGYHECAAPGCTVVVPVEHLMCYRHWVRVPARDRAQVAFVSSRWEAGRASADELRAAQEACVRSLTLTATEGGAT